MDAVIGAFVRGFRKDDSWLGRDQLSGRWLTLFEARLARYLARQQRRMRRSQPTSRSMHRFNRRESYYSGVTESGSRLSEGNIIDGENRGHAFYQ